MPEPGHSAARGRGQADTPRFGLRRARRQRLGTSGILLLGLALSAAPALAHKLNVFAAAEGRRIQGEVYFAGGGKAADVPVLVQSAAGEVLAALRTGADGGFAYEATAPVAHRIVAETPDGHRAEWRIGAAELAGAFPAADATGAGMASSATPAPDAAAVGSASHMAAPTSPDCALDPALAAAIERAVAQQVRPLREEVLAAREAVQLRDVLGGIGYIVGLAGLGLWQHGRRMRQGR